jgi:ribonuclease J
MVLVSLAMTDRGQLAANIEVELIGVPDNAADGEALAEVAYDAAVETFEQLPKPRRRDPDSVEEAVRRGVRAALAQRWGKKPNVTVHVLIV